MNENVTIKNGKVYGMRFSEYFNVRLGDDNNPSICPVIDFDGMPVKTLAKLAFDSMKVKGRPAMKKLSTENLKKTYKGTVHWTAFISKEGASQHAAITAMSDEELEAMIIKIKAERAAKKDDFDTAVEEFETNNEE